MNNDLQFSAMDDGPVDAALADYFDRVDRGECIALTQIIAAHPGCEDGLRRFLNQESKLHAVTAASPVVATLKNETDLTLGDFRILRELGRGGMGLVYEAEQLSLGRRVALKVLPFAPMLDKQQLARFKNEARAAATLDHPNIVAVHSVGSEGSVHYYAMELIDGQSLAEVIAVMRRAKKLTPSSAERDFENGALSTDAGQVTTDFAATNNEHLTTDAQHLAALSTPHAPSCSLPAPDSREFYRTFARLGIQAAEALDHAHQSGVLHRDIKPGNLMLDGDGNLHVTDFGLARIEADAGMTMTGDIVGTLRYMAPEQALAKRVVVDHRADIYALGATLYELLTLQPAFAETDRSELLKQIAFNEPRLPRQLNPRIPVELETIVLKGMRKSPEQRYATARDLADDLQCFLDNKPIKAKPPKWKERAVKWRQRHPAVVWGAVLILLTTTAISTFSAVVIADAYHREAAQRKLTETERQHAEAERQRAELERERADSNFRRARQAISDILVNGARGTGEWADIPPKFRDKLAEQAVNYAKTLIHEDSADPSLQFETAVGYQYLALLPGPRDEKQNPETWLPRAMEILERLHSEYPDVSDYRSQLAIDNYILGSTRFQQNKLDEAIDKYREAVRLAPTDTAIRGNFGVVLFRKGLLDESIVELREAIHLDPKHTIFRADLGSALMEKGLLDEAITECHESVRCNANEPFAHFVLGIVLEEKALMDEAIDEYSEAVRLDSNAALYHSHLADVLHQKGLWDKAALEYQAAIAAYRDAIRENSEDFESVRDYAQLLVTCGNNDLRDPQESIRLAGTAIKQTPTDGELWSILGIAHYRMGNHRDAVEALLTSCGSEKKEERSTFFFLAMAEWQLGNREAARNWYSKAIDWMNQHPQIVGGKLHRFRAEAEQLLGIPAPAS